MIRISACDKGGLKLAPYFSAPPGFKVHKKCAAVGRRNLGPYLCISFHIHKVLPMVVELKCAFAVSSAVMEVFICCDGSKKECTISRRSARMFAHGSLNYRGQLTAHMRDFAQQYTGLRASAHSPVDSYTAGRTEVWS